MYGVQKNIESLRNNAFRIINSDGFGVKPENPKPRESERKKLTNNDLVQ